MEVTKEVIIIGAYLFTKAAKYLLKHFKNFSIFIDMSKKEKSLKINASFDDAINKLSNSSNMEKPIFLIAKNGTGHYINLQHVVEVKHSDNSNNAQVRPYGSEDFIEVEETVNDIYQNIKLINQDKLDK